MNKILSVIVALLGVLFVLIGLRWLIDPSAAAAHLGMSLLEGVGRSTQIGDFSAFFLTLGTFILIALGTSKRVWYYPAIMLLGMAAVGRVLAWFVHDAALAIDMIVPEIVIASFLLLAARRLTTGATGQSIQPGA